MTDKEKKVDVDFNEALRRIAHTPRQIIEYSLKNKEASPSVKDDDAKAKKAKG